MQPLRPQGSDSAMARISLAIRGRSPQGRSTSPQERCVCLAARNSASSLLERRPTAAERSPDSEYGSYSYPGNNSVPSVKQSPNTGVYSKSLNIVLLSYIKRARNRKC